MLAVANSFPKSLGFKIFPLEDSCFLSPTWSTAALGCPRSEFQLPLLASSAVLLLQGLSRLGAKVLTHLY